ncbi:hypothetical protein DFH27DRAFT_529373 [Peziza echinospora]|nr:hypothetical protein DFH27DRAFT_529373 [Peziza echinospora]
MDHTDAREQSVVLLIAAALKPPATSRPNDGSSASLESPLETVDAINGGQSNDNDNDDDSSSSSSDHSSRDYCPTCGWCITRIKPPTANIDSPGPESSQQATAEIAPAAADITTQNQQPLQAVETSDSPWDATTRANDWEKESDDGWWGEDVYKPVRSWEGYGSIDMIALESKIAELVDERIRVLFGGDLWLIETLIEKYGRRPEPTWETGSKMDIMVDGPTSLDAGQATVALKRRGSD